MTRARILNASSIQPLTGWINERIHAPDRWLGKPCVFAAWAGLLLAFLTRRHGTGLSVCWIESATGIPCPGCGLTRSLSCGLRGMFTESWHYHPMGLLILALFVIIVAASLLPRLRRYLNSLIESKARLFNLL